MSVVQFQCPSCQTPLRLENRALFVGRTFACPDCRDTLLIEADGSSGVKAKVIPADVASTELRPSNRSHAAPVDPSLARRVGLANASQSSNPRSPLHPGTSTWQRLMNRPSVLGWSVAALFALMLILALSGRRNLDSPVAAKPNEPQQGSADVASSKNVDSDEPPSDPKPSVLSEPEPNPVKNDADSVAANATVPAPALPVGPVANLDPRPPEHRAKVEVPMPPNPAAEEDPKIAKPPISPLLSAEVIEAKLQQKILRFEQAKPAAFVKVLEIIEDLAGVPIVWDLEHVDDEQLQKPVTIQLKQTTAGEALDSLLKQVGLGRRITEGKIELYLPSPSNE